MTLTGLETILITAGATLLSGLLTKMWCDRHSVSQNDCKDCHAAFESSVKALCKKVDDWVAQQNRVNRIILTKLHVPLEDHDKLDVVS